MVKPTMAKNLINREPLRLNNPIAAKTRSDQDEGFL
jgi:hypothetical protein